MKKIKNVTPLQPEVTLDEILAYEHDKPETHTRSRIVNAVCEKMFQKNVMMPEQVAQSLGVERIKLTHTLELLTGYSLNDIRLEMLVKRWHEYRQAHPSCKEKELAALMGYRNYNAYWRFMERNRKRFPELRGEDEDVSGHIKTVMAPLMKKESVMVCRFYYLLPYRGGRAEAEACARLLYRHGCIVAERALSILNRHPELELRRDEVRDAALLHNIGIVWTDAPELHCHGHEPYSAHASKGSNWLSKRQQPTLSFAAWNHDLTQDLAALYRPLDKLIAYASAFYSIHNPSRPRTLDEIRQTLAQYGEKAVKRFDELHQMLG